MSLLDLLENLADPRALAAYRADPGPQLAKLPPLARTAMLTAMPEWIEHLAAAELADAAAAAAPDRPAPTAAMPPAPPGLSVVGTGMTAGQLTPEARACVQSAGKLLYGTPDPVTERLLRRLNPSAESLAIHYRPGAPRREAYAAMTARILACLREHESVCAAFYGHPGIFVRASHAAVAEARAAGFPARMLPAVSSIDCLFADLGVDPAAGCIILEATDLLANRRRLDSALDLVLLQIGAVGEAAFRADGFHGEQLPTLVDFLLGTYAPDHPAVVYEATAFALCPPRMTETTIGGLVSVAVTGRSTLYVPAHR